jgi:hypothetical protein
MLEIESNLTNIDPPAREELFVNRNKSKRFKKMPAVIPVLQHSPWVLDCFCNSVKY